MPKCDLCKSKDGVVREYKPIPEFGNVGDIAIQQFPFYRCICSHCRTILDNYEKCRREAVKKRTEFVDAERKRRRKNDLCSECGGKVSKSGPYRVYEGTYATEYRCNHCGKSWEYT